jgi:hypothetical protein
MLLDYLYILLIEPVKSIYGISYLLIRLHVRLCLVVD